MTVIQRALSVFFLCGAVVLSHLAAPVMAQETGGATTSLQSLLDTLKDETQRNALISELETLAGAQDATTTEEESEPPSLATQMADLTTTAVNDVVEISQRLYTDISRIRLLFTTLDAEGRAAMLRESTALLATIVTTSVIFLGLYRLLKSLIVVRREDKNTRLHSRALTLFLHLLVGMISLVLAYLAGYALAYFVFGEPGLDDTQALYLNSFFMVGVFGVVLRLVVSGDERDVTVSSLPTSAQSTILHQLRLVFGVAAYGIMAAAPIVQSWTNFLVGRSVRAIVVLIAVILALYAIRAIKRSVTRASESPERDEKPKPREVLWSALWPWLAVLYVLTCFVIAVTRQSSMVELITIGTLYTVAAYAVFTVAFRLLSATGSIRLPNMPRLELALPGLTNRLNTLVPPLLFMLSVILALFAFGLLLSGWTNFNVFEGISSAQSGWSMKVINAAILVLIFIVLWAVVASWIDNRLTLDLPGRNVSARTRTLLSLFRNAFTIAIIVVGIMTVLSEIGINIAPLLAGAGVVGLAIGFGAQKMVQDIITGVFIQLENAINEGDVISVAGITGAVEKLTIRSVSLRSIDGQFHIIPFSAVDTVSNYMRRFAYHVAEIGVAYSAQIPAVKDAMLEAFNRLRETEHNEAILEDFEMHGVTALGDSAVVVRGRIKTQPGSQWAVGRAYTELVKTVLDEREIEIPFPHRELKFPKEMLAYFAKPVEKQETPPSSGTIASSDVEKIDDGDND